MTQYDILTIGRCSLDLFSEQIGAPFVDIESFSTQVGGSPTNIAIGSARLGLASAAVTAVGDDMVGQFVRAYLSRNNVGTNYVYTKPGRTAMAVVGVEPPDTFPLVFYRDAAPDKLISTEDIKLLPYATTNMLLVAGANYADARLRDASLLATQIAREHQVTTIIDLDLRPTMWPSAEAYQLNMQAALPTIDIVIGTIEEMLAAFEPQPELSREALPDSTNAIQQVLSLIEAHQQPHQTIVLKRGAAGVSIFTPNGKQVDVSSQRVEVLNTVGAGDSFAAGLLYARQNSLDWEAAARFANACGAIVVTRHGCAAAMPTLNEVTAFLEGDQ